MEDFGRAGISPEAHDEMRLFGLIGLVQHHVTNALRYEERLRLAAMEARQPSSRTESFAVHSVQGNRHAQGGHNRIILSPEHGERPIGGIERIIMRVPEVTPFDDPDNTIDYPMWNDIFLELHTSQDESQDFLLNSQGLKPFFDANTDIEMVLDTGMRPDLYSVRVDQSLRSTIQVDLEMLDHIVDTYVYQPQYRANSPPFNLGEVS